MILQIAFYNFIELTHLFPVSVPFGVENIVVSPGDIQPELVAALYQLFPSWPPASAVKCLKWRYSQVSRTPEKTSLSGSRKIISFLLTQKIIPDRIQ